MFLGLRYWYSTYVKVHWVFLNCKGNMIAYAHIQILVMHKRVQPLSYLFCFQIWMLKLVKPIQAHRGSFVCNIPSNCNCIILLVIRNSIYFRSHVVFVFVSQHDIVLCSSYDGQLKYRFRYMQHSVTKRVVSFINKSCPLSSYFS